MKPFILPSAMTEALSGGQVVTGLGHCHCSLSLCVTCMAVTHEALHTAVCNDRGIVRGTGCHRSWSLSHCSLSMCVVVFAVHCHILMFAIVAVTCGSLLHCFLQKVYM